MGPVAGADDGRQAQLAADDGGVAEVRPPWSVTMAAARFIIGTQSGSVMFE